MCGIVGYSGPQSAATPLIEGLRRLEYRGYDSAGIALGTQGKLFIEKKAGKLSNLEGSLDSSLPVVHSGIGHTRWATHGGPTDGNAHPHVDNEGKLAVIHNGIIENYSELRKELEARGHKFSSETDTESVAHLLSDLRKKHNGDLSAAMREAVKALRGSFTLLAIHGDAPEVVVGVRRNSPLVVGLGNGENFMASDVAAFIDYTKCAIELGQDEVVTMTPTSVKITDLDGKAVAPKEYQITWDASAAQKGGFTHFMLKEIFEQPKAVADTLIGRLSDNKQIVLDELRMSADEIRALKKITVIACGTAYHAGLVAKYAIEKWAKIPVDVEIASEFRYRDPIIDAGTLVIAISQSGETMDTLMAVRHAKAAGGRVLAICNTNSSTIPRESDAVLYTHAGPEIAVASTKALLTQMVAVYLIGLHLAQVNGALKDAEVESLYKELLELPGKIEQILETVEPLRALTRSFAENNIVLFLGRNIGYPVALEGALKLKELAYIHAEGFAGGELKHGPIALIDKGTPVIAILPAGHEHALDEKMLSNIQEVKARGARVIVIAEEGAHVEGAEHIIRIPVVPALFQPVLATVPLQVFAYEMAVARGNDVDQPRNLAKSVTVE
ncbi:glucosamine--fructose-6-phosphate aminotransferase (isomerizing) [Candidatus Planktophila vernalis]|uniref:Glutamine--fructose-6-phosphate aminotransferase [isomerizing] n=1 Tax=Candidatus Planktophila vernalis TaxID=1884907 RepID=A0A249KRW5_9ACTN|nr:glutamine--fructose-6-phosphate transaminase (isomerizing) [Candidatus Planktophila vernalis]ASY19524.1 glucosamine--fructose-6-phosphate aminotransferase (isomerizing) [Candidatus Planktophila vernalis]